MSRLKLKKGQKKRLFSIIGGGVLFLLGIVFHLVSLPVLGDISFIGAGVFAGALCVTRAVRGIFSGIFFDENTLMTIAALGALALGEYEECAAVMILYQLGELFQSIAVGRSRQAIKALGALCPDHANLVTDEGEKTVSPRELSVGDMIVIKPGERIPADCVITEGETSVDSSPVTGESLPRDHFEGDKLFSGCINQTGVVICKVEAVAAESAAERILALAQSAGDRKTRSEAFITRFAAVYTPAVCIIALLVAVVVPSVLSLLYGNFTALFLEWSRRALTMLVISCPCALVISVPLGYFCGMGNASANGVLIKGSAYMDALASVDTAVFDKTGTLTEGVLSISEIETRGGVSEEELLSLACAAEENSSHPVAKAIIARAEKKYTAKSVTELAGRGVFAVLCDEREIQVVRPEKGTARGTAVDVLENGEMLGRIFFEDTVRPNVRSVTEGLCELGIKKTVMLTGDNKAAAERVGLEAGIEDIRAELLPEDKYREVEKLCSVGRVMYVGDGINDTPSLARAHVGVAMGALGNQAAVESGDIVLMSSDMEKLRYGIRLSKRTVLTVKVNIAMSLLVKAAVLILATLDLVGMWAAIVADVGVCILAVTNSMRLLRR